MSKHAYVFAFGWSQRERVEVDGVLLERAVREAGVRPEPDGWISLTDLEAILDACDARSDLAEVGESLGRLPDNPGGYRLVGETRPTPTVPVSLPAGVGQLDQQEAIWAMDETNSESEETT